MTISLRQAIDLNNSVKLTLTRLAKGSYVDGKWVNGRSTTVRLLGSPQQPSPEMLQILPEGESTRNVVRFICNKAVRLANEASGTSADVIKYQNKGYKVIASNNWDAFGYYDVLAVEEA